jgi:hypothetical protein
VKENFRPSTDHGGYDGERESLRYLEWAWDPNPDDSTFIVDYAYLLRAADASVRVEHDRHVEGLFSRADWLRLLSRAGFERIAVLANQPEIEPAVAFVARKPLV